MNKFILLAVMGLAAFSAPMKDDERQRLIAHFEMTNRWLDQEVAGLSPEQYKFRAGEGKWSILDVVEHLYIAEPQYWEWLTASMKEERKDFKSKGTDSGILWYGIDRTQRNTTAKERTPEGKFTNIEEPMKAFRKLRAEMMESAKSTQVDLRSNNFKGGGMDEYQWFLMISTHSQRHILQIQEIKANPKFPKK